MLGIVIVEDEAIVRMELQSMLDWEKLGFVILGEAENGKKGMELILKEKPDIVITDIKMPVMDGLEMIRSVKSHAPDIRYIILSSYEEFGLLKTAMNYGVTDYLIKLELTPEILKSTLENQKKAIFYENKALESKGISSISRVAQLLRQVLAGYYICEELDSTLKLANPGIDTHKLSCIAVRFSMPGRKIDFGENDRRTLEVSAHSIINDIVVTYFKGISFLADVGLCMFVYSPGSDGDKVAEMCGVVINMLRQYLNLASVVGVSSLEGGVENIHRIMIDSVKAAEEVFFKGYGAVIFSSEVVNDDMTGDAQILNSWGEPLRQVLELRETGKIKEVFDEALGLLSPPAPTLLKKPEDPGMESPSRRRISRNSAFNLCFSMISIVLSVVKDVPGEQNLFSENLYEMVNSIETMEGLRDWIKSFKEKVLEMFSDDSEKSYDDHLVTAAKRYIVENCHKPINLDMVAKSLSISSGYLSSIFKRRTQTGFVEYVTGVKLERAKKLLLSGQYKIYEVSYMVGFEDTGYFSKTFHKITGQSPKDFIALHS